MSSEHIEVRMTTSFRRQLAEYGFAGPPELLRPVIAAVMTNKAISADEQGVYWFERQVIRPNRRISPVRLWLGGTLDQNIFTLSQIRYEQPGER